MLLVDDDVALFAPLARSLRTTCEVTTESDPREALRRLESGQRFDAILCDVQMPELSGPELHAAVLAAHPDQARRFVFLTGGLDVPEIRRSVTRTGRRVLAKPARRAELLAAIEEVVASEGSGL